MAAENCDADQPVEQLSAKTRNKSIACKFAIEQYYANIMTALNSRRERRAALEKMMEEKHLPSEEQERYRAELRTMETNYLRLRRVRITAKEFETIKLIGKGGFGEVWLVRAKYSGDLYAMKKMNKAEMIKRDQIVHVRAERDALVDNRLLYSDNPWIVHLYYSFQDKDYLYLIMEYLPGGDLMGALIKRKVFSEDVARFYMAELVLAVESIHKMGYIHRDLKPDNLLLDHEGHLKISDFGLAAGLRTTALMALYKRLEGQAPPETNSPPLTTESLSSSPSWRDMVEHWKRHRRIIARSMVGTPDYIAPEVFEASASRGEYGPECDWWSVGTIMYEMLVGYAPFCSRTQQETYHKIMNWKNTLRFPAEANLSREAQDLIERLVCDRHDRLGAHGGDADEIKRHPWFKDIQWDTLRSRKDAPLAPKLKGPLDTSHFDDLEPGDDEAGDEGKENHQHAAPPTAEAVRPENGTKHQQGRRGAGVVHRFSTVRFSADDIPFIGYTYKSFDAVRDRPSLFNFPFS